MSELEVALLGWFSLACGKFNIQIGFGGCFGSMEGTVRSVGGNVSQKRFAGRLLGFDELLCVVKENIGAVAFDWNRSLVVPIASTKIRVVPIVGSLPNAAAPVTQDFGIAAILRAIGIVVTQMPLAKHSGRIPGITENLSDRWFVLAQHAASHDRVPHSSSVGPMARLQCCSSRRAGRSNVIIF